VILLIETSPAKDANSNDMPIISKTVIKLSEIFISEGSLKRRGVFFAAF